MKLPTINRLAAAAGLVALGAVLAQAQTPTASEPSRHERRAAEKGEAVYDDLGYKAAVPLLEGEGRLSPKRMARLANAYRLNHDTRNAELWYGQVVAAGQAEPEHLLYYAQALQSNGKLDESARYYQAYEEARGREDARGRRGVRALRDGVAHADVRLRNERAANTDHLDFSPTYYRDGVVFVTTRKQRGLRHRLRDLWTDDNFMSLAYAEADPATGELSAAREFAPELNTKYHEGPLCFADDGRRVYFTRNTYNKGHRRDSREGVMRLNLYVSDVDADGAWGAPRELPVNTDDYEEAHPAVSADGRYLYFASDRPGGYGGMDLYVSRFAGGTWGMPDNLGPAVNTAGNEAFPVLHANGKLYFASDGLGGLGGLDIFAADVRAVRGEGDVSVGAPVNIGAPFNSAKDDFGFVANDDLTRGYLTSARGGADRDDIYSFVAPQTATRRERHVICVYEQPDESRRLAGAVVTVREVRDGEDAFSPTDRDMIVKLRRAPNTDEYTLTFAEQRAQLAAAADATQRLKTGTDGTVSFEAEAGVRYDVEVSYPGFEAEGFEFTPGQTAGAAPERCVGLRPATQLDRPTVGLTGVTRNGRYDNVLAGVELTLVDLCTGEEQTTRSGPDGSFAFGCVPCGCEFVIRGEKHYFAAAETVASTLGDDCAATPCTQGGRVAVSLAMMPEAPGGGGAPAPPVAALPAAPSTPPHNDRVAMHRRPRASYELGGGVLEAGAVIELKNIYYDFDESYIRDDARDDLDQVVALMEAYPGMLIELGSHTDARASAAYNRGLSQRRAEEAREYLVRRGVDGRRVEARGFGESQLRNHCADFVTTCSEFEHQVNRRTEVKIVSMGHADVEVRYVSEGPEKVDAADPSRVFVWK